MIVVVGPGAGGKKTKRKKIPFFFIFCPAGHAVENGTESLGHLEWVWMKTIQERIIHNIIPPPLFF